MKLSRQDFHHYFYIFATGLLMFVVPLSHFAMGLITFLLTLNWIAEWNWKEKWSRLRQHPQALVFSGLYLVMCIGLIHADHLSNATEQLLANLSIFFAPIIAGAKIAEYFIAIIEAKNYALFALPAIGILQFIFALCFCKSLNRKVK